MRLETTMEHAGFPIWLARIDHTMLDPNVDISTGGLPRDTPRIPGARRSAT